MPDLKVTTSWDDGDVHVPKLADLLDRHGLRGTFYVSRVCPEAERMTEAGIREISIRHEVGAHTLRHVRLDWVTTRQAREEIFGSRAWLADVLGHEPTSFCYPWGKWSERVVDLVREAGFTYARTIEHLSFGPPADPLLQGTTTQTLPQSYYIPRLLTLRGDRQRLLTSFPSRERFMVELARVSATRNVPFHVWGHAWEVERFDQWALLDRLFDRIRTDFRVTGLSNAELDR